MASEIAGFLEDRDRFGSVVVTTAEEMPVQESLELLQAMQDRLDRRPGQQRALRPAGLRQRLAKQRGAVYLAVGRQR